VKTDPPLDRWEEEGAIQELERLAAELPDVGADKAWERLRRLTENAAQEHRGSLPGGF
jgi:hypothetical protein